MKKIFYLLSCLFVCQLHAMEGGGNASPDGGDNKDGHNTAFAAAVASWQEAVDNGTDKGELPPFLPRDGEEQDLPAFSGIEGIAQCLGMSEEEAEQRVAEALAEIKRDKERAAKERLKQSSGADKS